MLVASIAEIVSIGSVLPFLGVLTAPEVVFKNPLMQPFIEFFSITDPAQLFLPLTIVFIIAALFAGLIRLLLLNVMIKLSFSTGADIGIDIFKRTLYQDYEVHISRNSGEVVNAIIAKTNWVVHGVISPALMLISSVILLFGITGILFAINAKVASISMAGFGILYLIIVLFTRPNLKQNSLIISEKSSLLVKTLQEALGAVRNVLLDGSQEFYCKLYRDSDIPLRHAMGSNQFIAGSPRFIMEGIGMVIIALLAYIIVLDGDILTTIPVLGTLALGAQRLLPALQHIYGSYSQISGSEASVNDVIGFLEQPLPSELGDSSKTSMVFDNKITLKNLSFRYTKNTAWVLKNISFEVKKGECIGFIGETGKGKSTLIDIIMGLFEPTEGQLIIDSTIINKENKKSWQSHIAHVPQNIYLSDSSMEENIAFGVPKDKIDYERVRMSAVQAQISEFIEGLDNGYQTFVGEQGIKISGGQRQRIGIARALYKNADVLIFDEATSALDNNTELLLMDTIKELSSNLTILIIAHRLTTLKECDKILELDKNHKVNIFNYKDIQK
jgi:ATP-binding cassette, subfamily B, bacterial PglK